MTALANLSPQALDWALRTVLESSILIALALLLERTLLRRRAAFLLQGLWLLVFARLLLPPLAPFGGAAAELSGVLASPGRAAVGLVALETRGAGMAAGVLLALWPAVAAWRLARLWLRAGATRRALTRASRPASARILAEARTIARAAGLRRMPRVRLHDGPAPALLLGIRRPLIVLAARLEGPARAAALWHECSHLRRRDPALQGALEVLHALWWFHPLLGLAKRRAATARELGCDATVMCTWDGGAETYRRVLLAEAARWLSRSAPAPDPALAFWRGPAALRQRLEALEDGASEQRSLAAGVPVALLACIALLAAWGDSRLAGAAGSESWWNDARGARAELELWRERRPGLGCTPGRLVFLRALALEQGYHAHSNP